MGMESIIIFGSGQVGYDALMFFGSENVYGFCDNDPALSGKEKYGKPVLCFEKLRSSHQDAVVMIAAAGHAAYDIAAQCEENGISDYLLYRFLREVYPNYDGMQMLRYISEPLSRAEIRKAIYYKRSEELKGQLEYFKRHADIKHMKPAIGKLRYQQEQCVQTSSSFIKKVEKLNIKPFLYGGNLLGYVRHGGFIPWDDDVDFALIRGEYERLKEYCKKNIYSVTEWYKKTDVGEKKILPELERYYWYLWHDHFSVVEVREDSYIVGMDFFPLEYYVDHYSFTELMLLKEQMRREVVCKNSEEEKVEFVNHALEENKENTAGESDQIYYGLDNMELQHRYHKGCFIPKNVVFPLKQVLWEGELFWVPNDAEEFLTYEFENPWSFPNDVGIPLHLNISQEEM